LAEKTQVKSKFDRKSSKNHRVVVAKARIEDWCVKAAHNQDIVLNAD